jgi:hypothetical protein
MDWMFLCQDKLQGPAHFEDGYLITISAPKPCSVDGRMTLNMERLAETHERSTAFVHLGLKTPLEHLFPELPNTYLSRNIKSVSELYGQRTY